MGESSESYGRQKISGKASESYEQQKISEKAGQQKISGKAGQQKISGKAWGVLVINSLFIDKVLLQLLMITAI